MSPRQSFDLGQVRGEAEAEQRPFEVSPAASSQLISSTCRAKPCHSLSNSIFLPEAMQSWPQQPHQPQNWNFFFPLDKSWLWDRLVDRNKAKSRFVFHSPMRAGTQFRFFLSFFCCPKDNDTHVTLLRTKGLWQQSSRLSRTVLGSGVLSRFLLLILQKKRGYQSIFCMKARKWMKSGEKYHFFTSVSKARFILVS